jgi:hypothetical protein
MSDHDIAEAMIRWGGSFVAGLGSLFYAADPINQDRLKAAFKDYWDEYRTLAELHQQRTAR